jgi:hypothetical protein
MPLDIKIPVLWMSWKVQPSFQNAWSHHTNFSIYTPVLWPRDYYVSKEWNVHFSSISIWAHQEHGFCVLNVHSVLSLLPWGFSNPMHLMVQIAKTLDTKVKFESHLLTVCQLSITVINTWDNQFKGGKTYFGSGFQKFQHMVAWP